MRLLHRSDIVIIILSLALVGASLTVYARPAGKPEVHVGTQSGTWIYPLDTDLKAEFDGPVGHTTIEILDGKVRVLDSDCRNKLCVASGWISRNGQWIACLPNAVIITIEGSNDGLEDVDDTAF